MRVAAPVPIKPSHVGRRAVLGLGTDLDLGTGVTSNLATNPDHALTAGIALKW